MRGWGELYRHSWRLGARNVARGNLSREALIRLVVPLDPSRYLELPDADRELAARPGERVLDLASPKLLASLLARRGVEVVCADAYEAEIATWRALTAGIAAPRFDVADGRALPYASDSFDHAFSISVIEHIPAGGDRAALAELARVVRPGGRIVITVPCAERARDVFRRRPLYGGTGGDEPAFFERHYDDAGLAALAATPGLELRSQRIVRLSPNLHRAHERSFPLLLWLGPLFGLLASERAGPPGDVARLTFSVRG